MLTKSPYLISAIIGSFGLAGAVSAAPEAKPNVLFISIDDLRDWVGHLGGYGGNVHTPNIDRLAAQGVAFTNAHCPSPVCNPSRTAIMTGRMPSQTGVYDNAQWLAPNHPDMVTIPAYFRRHGYIAVGAGKIYHHTAGSNPPIQWDAYHHLYFRESPWFRSSRVNYPWSPVSDFPPGFPFSGVRGLGGEFDWGALPIADEQYDDAKTVAYALDFLSRAHDRPFFLACGIYRPHLPWYVPQRFFDLYPLDDIVLPPVKEDDCDDIPSIGRQWAEYRRADVAALHRADAAKRGVQAYLAAVSYADDQVGRLMAGLAASPAASNTIVVLWSDHGWHLGEKGHWHKFTLWEEATRVPFVVVAPGVTAAGGRSGRPVNLVDIFPTLTRLCRLPDVEGVSGADLTPLLRDPEAVWERPSVIEYLRGNAAVRDERFRYIRYRDGTEELYDHATDPNEWYNLATEDRHAAVKAELTRWLPTRWADPVPSKNAFEFDPAEYSWRSKATGIVVSARGEPAAMTIPPRAVEKQAQGKRAAPAKSASRP